jgi:enoyl-CoA hydratase/carnithine racemase
MGTDAFRIEEDLDRRFATVRLARGANGNKIAAHEIPLLGRTIRELGSRPEFKLVLVRGDGENFCQGRLPDPPGTAPKTALEIRTRVTEAILGCYDDVRTTPAPVIAIVQGEAKGFGCAFVSQCDLAIASDEATFALPEMDHHLPPTLAISAMLHKVPPKRILQMVYTREVIGAQEALSLGILSELAPSAFLEAAVDKTVSTMLDRNRAALAGVKEYMNGTLHAGAYASARLASNLLAAVLSSPRED